MKALVLLGHGSRGVERPLAPLREWTARALPGAVVEDAYLTQAPELEAVLRGLGRAGAGEVRVVPMLVSAGHHLDVELPSRMRRLAEELPGLRLSLAPALGADAALVELVRLRAAQAAPLAPPAAARP